MKPKDIQQMFRDAADLRKMTPLDKEREATEARFAELSKQYKADWKAALQYLAGILQQMDTAVPETAPMNKATWAVIAPAVQKFYGGEKVGKNEEPVE